MTLTKDRAVVSTTPKNLHHHYFSRAVKFSPRLIKQEMAEVKGFNAKFAVLITKGVGTMACAYLFCLIALVSLPAILEQANVLPKSDLPHFFSQPGLILIVAWIAQTFIQLVLLSIIMVGQSVQSLASDDRATKTFDDVQSVKQDLITALDLLDCKTEGGLKDVIDRLDKLNKRSK